MIRPPVIRCGIRGVLAALVAAAPLFPQSIPVKEATLSNGMRVLMVERHDEPTIAAGWLARVGSSNERPGITGIAHLFEHMMFKGSTTIGTKDMKKDAELNNAQDKIQAEIRKEMSLLREKQRRGEIKDMMDPKSRTPRLQGLLDEFDKLVLQQRELIVKDEMDKIYKQAGGTGLNASTSQDRTFYIISIPANKLELWAWIESDRLANPVFREFYSERNVILEERRQTLESRPDGLIGEAFNAMTWMASPYHWQVIGWPSDISQVTREQAVEVFATFYAPNNITAILVGDFNADKALPMLEKYFGRVKPNPKGVPEIITTEPAQPAEQRMLAEAETSPSIQISYKGVPAVHKDAPAFQVLAAVLSGSGGGGGGRGGGGGGRASGRLNKSLVLDQKVATSASAGARGQKLGGTFTLRATPAQGRTPQDLEPLLYAELQKIVKDGITDQELERVKNAAQIRTFTAAESNTGLRGALAEAEATGTYKDFLEAPARLQAVTKADVQRVAAQYLTRENRSVLIVTRKGATPEGGRANRTRGQQSEVK
jgi:predicted Zn-dependent peptidase